MLRVAIALGVVVLLSGCSEVVETGPQAEAGEDFAEVIVTVLPSTSTTAPTSSGGVPGVSFETGDCLTWEQGASEVVFEVVACSEEHYAEVAGLGDLATIFPADEPFPDTEALSAAVEDLCVPIVEQYLAAVPADIEVEAGVIPPTEAGWDAGDRDAWCTVGLPRQDGRRPPYTGRLADGSSS